MWDFTHVAHACPLIFVGSPTDLHNTPGLEVAFGCSESPPGLQEESFFDITYRAWLDSDYDPCLNRE